MKTRCKNPKDPAYEYYGGRGIRVAPEFESFESFLNIVGPKPGPEYSLDRYPDNNGNYEPGNVRWATKQQQARNMRSNRLATFNGKTQRILLWKANPEPMFILKHITSHVSLRVHSKLFHSDCPIVL
jgi:hypothetical protein